MSDEQKQPNPHEAEQKDVAAQAGAINMISRASELLDGLPFGGSVRLLGKTDFENHQLNDMINMVESANPEHLETAGKALWDARDAIKAAADELEGHVGRVEWEGESGTAFREWGGKLVKHAIALSDFAEVAGTQITAAATGLASVRSSMPPRDTRISPKKVEQIPAPAQVEGNKEYTAAIQAEKDRQEAINQMNRLASFYSVSEETLAAQDPPVFEAMPNVGVPKPAPTAKNPFNATEGQSSSELGNVHTPVSTVRDSSDGTTGHSRSVDTPPKLSNLDDTAVSPDSNVGTKIDSVGTLTPQDTVKSPVNAPTTTGSGGGSGSVSPILTGGAPPAFGGVAGRSSGFGGTPANRAPISAQGRAGTTGGTTGARGNTGPVSRAAATGQSAAGRAGGTAAGRPLMGRGVSGGTPRPVGGTPNARGGGIGSTGAARGNGVVGGRPTNGTTSGTTGPRVPRGTVVGAEGNNGSRTPTGRIAQRGVIGAPNTNNRPGPTARPTAGNSDGVVGKPTGRAPADRTGNVPGGGAGTRKGPKGSRRNRNREDRDDERQRGAQPRNAPPATDD
ncbi:MULTISPECIES: WXG100 family type VII secretion target [Streptomyces]|uniref:WXG100 family type VII secretion target n=2 Tax=Streptomyces TaxID=1883 RepID=A0ABV9J8E1_9ACTN